MYASVGYISSSRIPNSGFKHRPDMKTHTTLDLDRELLAEAAAALGTTRTTDTVHAALREAVARQKRARLMTRDWTELKTLLPELRAPRSFLPQPGETSAALAAVDPEGRRAARARGKEPRKRR
jgi:Arc/MetJ family transcription regulator